MFLSGLWLPAIPATNLRVLYEEKLDPFLAASAVAIFSGEKASSPGELRSSGLWHDNQATGG